jgi:hypothetical protein
VIPTITTELAIFSIPAAMCIAITLDIFTGYFLWSQPPSLITLHPASTILISTAALVKLLTNAKTFTANTFENVHKMNLEPLSSSSIRIIHSQNVDEYAAKKKDAYAQSARQSIGLQEAT